MENLANESESIWTKNFTMNFVTNFLVNLNMYLLIVLIASYAQEQFNASDSSAGLVAGLFIVGSLIGRFVMGKYINSMGPRKVLIIGTALFAITSVFYFIESSLIFLLIVRILNGFSFGICTTSTGSIAGYITPESKKGEGISFFSLSMVLGAALGPFLGLLLLQQFSIEVIFGLNFILSLIAFVFALFMKIPFETIAPSKTEKGFKISDFVAKEAIPIAIVVFIAGLSYSSILNFIKIFAQERDLIAASSYFFMVYALVSVIARPMCGRLMDSKNENAVIYPSIIFYALCFLVIAFSHTSWMLLLGGALLGLGFGNLTSTSQSVSVKVVPKEKIARATSTFFIGLDLGLGFGPYILGLFTSDIGLGNMYILMAILLVVTFFIYYFIHGRKVQSV
ncbi:MFS transporter [Staphylococcus sp. GSSP0090]|nr:MFS transporter [Staphylococcus sp. GSSP0090]